MERNNTIARDTIATPNPRTLLSFEAFLSVYQAKVGQCQWSAETIAASRGLWDAMPRRKQRALTKAVRDGTWCKPRLDWTLSDYQEPEPTNYNGKATMPKDVPLVRAVYNGTGGIYTRHDAEAYGMDIKGDFLL